MCVYPLHFQTFPVGPKMCLGLYLLLLLFFFSKSLINLSWICVVLSNVTCSLNMLGPQRRPIDPWGMLWPRKQLPVSIAMNLSFLLKVHKSSCASPLLSGLQKHLWCPPRCFQNWSNKLSRTLNTSVLSQKFSCLVLFTNP